MQKCVILGIRSAEPKALGTVLRIGRNKRGCARARARVCVCLSVCVFRGWGRGKSFRNYFHTHREMPDV